MFQSCSRSASVVTSRFPTNHFCSGSSYSHPTPREGGRPSWDINCQQAASHCASLLKSCGRVLARRARVLRQRGCRGEIDALGTTTWTSPAPAQACCLAASSLSMRGCRSWEKRWVRRTCGATAVPALQLLLHPEYPFHLLFVTHWSFAALLVLRMKKIQLPHSQVAEKCSCPKSPILSLFQTGPDWPHVPSVSGASAAHLTSRRGSTCRNLTLSGNVL